jgi:serine/threonine-protein kinase RsbW
VVAVSSLPAWRNSNTVSFASTLYLLPVLDLLLEKIPLPWRHDVRLGLQEALVNAAKHGNNLDPTKSVRVRFYSLENQYWWVISNEGDGFEVPGGGKALEEDCCPDDSLECGRGMYILHQVFDKVEWDCRGTELRLCKSLEAGVRQPILT